MIKPSDFMVGDWVFNDEGIPRRVAQVTDVRFEGCSSGLILENGDEYNEVEAIPVTEEFLEKNGFKKYGDTGLWLEDDYYDIQIYEWSDSIWVFKYESTEMNIPYEQRIFSYVHSLQHALKECGVEKELVL